MEDTHHLREIILKLAEHLSDSDRNRLCLFLSNNISGRIRDDPSLGKKFDLIRSLFNQGQINEKDFISLIDALEKIQCFDAVRLLREHLRRIQSSGQGESAQNLLIIMSRSIEGQYENICTARSRLLNQQNLPNNNNIEMIDINSAIEIVGDQSSQSKEKKPFKRSSTNQKYLFGFIFLLLLIAGLALLAIMKFENDFKMKKKIINEQQAENGGMKSQLNYHRALSNQTIRKLTNELEKQNQTIEKLNNQAQQLFMELAGNKREIQDLNDESEQSHNENSELYENIRQLTDELHQCQQNKNMTIISTTTTPAPCTPTPGDGPCGCPNISICRQNCLSKFCATDGRCVGVLDLDCECLIKDVWQFKSNQC